MSQNGLVLFEKDNGETYIEVAYTFDNNGEKVLYIEVGDGTNTTVSLLSSEEARQIASELLKVFPQGVDQ